jgi:hypothetical protein
MVDLSQEAKRKIVQGGDGFRPYLGRAEYNFPPSTQATMAPSFSHRTNGTCPQASETRPRIFFLPDVSFPCDNFVEAFSHKSALTGENWKT